MIAAKKIVREAGELRVEWADGHASAYPLKALRLSCPCAVCVEEWTGQKLVRPEMIADDVRPVEARPVGNYALSIRWSDGHSSGIYAWDYLRGLCPCGTCKGEPGKRKAAG